MQIVAVLSQKGGGGKTTVATNLAVAAASAGMATLLLDMDPQQSALQWDGWRSRNRPTTKAPLFVWSAGRDNVVEKLAAAKSHKVKLVVIDTPPASDVESEIAARAAHLVLVVVQPSMFDLATLKDTFSLPSLAARSAHVLLNRAPATGTTLDDARKLIRTMGYQLAPVALTDRPIYRAAPIDGLGVVEAEKATAAGAREVAGLMKWVNAALAKLPKKMQAPVDDTDVYKMIGQGE